MVSRARWSDRMENQQILGPRCQLTPIPHATGESPVWRLVAQRSFGQYLPGTEQTTRGTMRMQLMQPLLLCAPVWLDKAPARFASAQASKSNNQLESSGRHAAFCSMSSCVYAEHTQTYRDD